MSQTPGLRPRGGSWAEFHYFIILIIIIIIIVITIIIIVIFIIAARVTNSWSSPLVRGFHDHHHIPPLHHYYWHHSASFLSRSTRLITGKVCSRSSFTRLPSPRYQTPGRRIRDASIVGRKLITSSADRIRDSAATTLTPNVERLLIKVFSTRWSWLPPQVMD